MPGLDYQTDTGPRLSCRFTMGEYLGKPNFLLQSSKGLLWHNLPPDLEKLVSLPNMGVSAKNFALGANGMFWYTYRSVNARYEQNGSTKLWSTLNEDWKGGCPIRLTFGSGGFFWGEKEWIEPNQGHLVQAFGMQPPSLIAESKKRYPNMKSYQIDFVALGTQGSWVMGSSIGDPCWNGVTDQLEKTLKREMGVGHKVKNVVLCPSRSDIYWIEYGDGTVDYFLPTDWDLKGIASHVTTHQNVVEDFWKPHDLTAHSGTTTTIIKQVRQDGAAWKFINDLFATGWRHPQKQPAPRIHYVFEVLLSQNLLRAYTNYVNQMEKKHKFASNGGTVGNQEYQWHGTRRLCQLGEDLTKTGFCANTGCPTCCIMTASFNANFAGHAPGRNFLRFGKAIYTSSVSSKADDYTLPTASGYRSLLLARVAKGNPHKRNVGDKKLTGPPAGYDCVEGIVGSELNYEECCLYNNDAVRPAFIILYKR